MAVDDVGEAYIATIKIPTDKVFRHRGWNSICYGGYIEEDNTFAITGDIKFMVKNEVWESLGLSGNVAPSESNCGRGPESTGCWYRVVNGNHIRIAFNCAFSYNAGRYTINSTAIPEKYRPKSYISSICSVNGMSIANISVNASGYVVVEWVQDLTVPGVTANYDVTWIDGYIDYYL